MLDHLEPYQPEKELGIEEPEEGYTTIYLKRLTMGDMMVVEGGLSGNLDRHGTRVVELFKRGVARWSNFLGIETDKHGITREIAYDEHALPLFPYNIREMIASKVLQISTMGIELETELRNAVRCAFLRTKAKEKTTWDCEHCMEEPVLQQARRCPFEKDAERHQVDPRDVKYLQPWDVKKLKAGRLPRWLTYGGHQFDDCPIGMAKPRAFALLKLIYDCEAANCLPFSPPVWTAQPYIYCEAKSIVNQERADIEQMQQKGRSITPLDMQMKARQKQHLKSHAEIQASRASQRVPDMIPKRAPGPRRVKLGQVGV